MTDESSAAMDFADAADKPDSPRHHSRSVSTSVWESTMATSPTTAAGATTAGGAGGSISTGTTSLGGMSLTGMTASVIGLGAATGIHRLLLRMSTKSNQFSQVLLEKSTKFPMTEQGDVLRIKEFLKLIQFGDLYAIPEPPDPACSSSGSLGRATGAASEASMGNSFECKCPQDGSEPGTLCLLWLVKAFKSCRGHASLMRTIGKATHLPLQLWALRLGLRLSSFPRVYRPKITERTSLKESAPTLPVPIESQCKGPLLKEMKADEIVAFNDENESFKIYLRALEAQAAASGVSVTEAFVWIALERLVGRIRDINDDEDSDDDLRVFRGTLLSQTIVDSEALGLVAEALPLVSGKVQAEVVKVISTLLLSNPTNARMVLKQREWKAFASSLLKCHSSTAEETTSLASPINSGSEDSVEVDEKDSTLKKKRSHSRPKTLSKQFSSGALTGATYGRTSFREEDDLASQVRLDVPDQESLSLELSLLSLILFNMLETENSRREVRRQIADVLELVKELHVDLKDSEDVCRVLLISLIHRLQHSKSHFLRIDYHSWNNLIVLLDVAIDFLFHIPIPDSALPKGFANIGIRLSTDLNAPDLLLLDKLEKYLKSLIDSDLLAVEAYRDPKDIKTAESLKSRFTKRLLTFKLSKSYLSAVLRVKGGDIAPLTIGSKDFEALVGNLARVIQRHIVKRSKELIPSRKQRKLIEQYLESFAERASTFVDLKKTHSLHLTARRTRAPVSGGTVATGRGRSRTGIPAAFSEGERSPDFTNSARIPDTKPEKKKGLKKRSASSDEHQVNAPKLKRKSKGAVDDLEGGRGDDVSDEEEKMDMLIMGITGADDLAKMKVKGKGERGSFWERIRRTLSRGKSEKSEKSEKSAKDIFSISDKVERSDKDLDEGFEMSVSSDSNDAYR